MEGGGTRTEYDSDVYRLTYPYEGMADALRDHVKKYVDVYTELAEAEETAGKQTQSADKIAALMVENTDLRETQDDIIITITDLIGGVE